MEFEKQTEAQALQFFALLKGQYNFGDPLHDRSELYRLGKSNMNIDSSSVDSLVNCLTAKRLVKVCYPDPARAPYRVDDWYLDLP